MPGFLVWFGLVGLFAFLAQTSPVLFAFAFVALMMAEE